MFKALLRKQFRELGQAWFRSSKRGKRRSPGSIAGLILLYIFTFISLLLMPATLVASFYGMNVELPIATYWWAWIAILALMVLLIGGLWYIFRRKKML